MTYNKSTAPSNCDVHWLSFTIEELMQALSTLSGHSIPVDARIDLDSRDGIDLAWQTPKEK